MTVTKGVGNFASGRELYVFKVPGTESFLPGPQTTRSFEADLVREICTLFPELDPDTGAGYSTAVRRTLRGFEAKVLLAGGLAA